MFEQLPDPERAVLTPDQERSRGHRFAIVINYFVLAYNVIHKLIMPVVMMVAAKVQSSSIHHLDWWWLYHVLLAVLLKRKNWDDKIMRFVVFTGFGGIFLQIFVTLKDYSWHIVSFWVTAMATAAVISYILTITRVKMNAKQHVGYLLTGLVFGVVLQFGLLGFKTSLLPDFILPETKHVAKEKNVPLLLPEQTCGQEAFALPLVSGQIKFMGKLMQMNQIQAESCGFPVALATFEVDHEILVSNHTGNYFNAKIHKILGYRWKSAKNLPLPHETPGHFNPSEISPDILMIYSDAQPKAGLLVLVRSLEALQAWVDNQPDHERKGAKKLLVTRSGLFFD